jgi:hypothetical protein
VAITIFRYVRAGKRNVALAMALCAAVLIVGMLIANWRAPAVDANGCPSAFQDITNLSAEIKDWAQFQSDDDVDRCLPVIARRLGPDALADWLNRSGLDARRQKDLGEDVVYFTWVISKEGGGNGKLLHGTSFSWLKLWFAWSEAYSIRWRDSESVKLSRSYTYH